MKFSTFTENRILNEALTEALKIVKKGFDKPDKRQDITKDIHNKEIDTAKKDMDPYVVGNANGVLVKKSMHAHEVRDGQSKPRDYGMDNDYILDLAKKVMAKPLFKKNEKTLVIYRNKKGKYDKMVVELEGRVFKIITIIQGNKRQPYDYMRGIHSKSKHVLVEQAKEFAEECLNEGIENILILD